MKEQIDTIPIYDAFDAGTECPLCKIYHDLEEAAVAFTMGPSYMEDDIRAQTDEKGFCPEHLRQMYAHGNRLGLALMMNTHFDKVIADMKKAAESRSSGGRGGLFFKKKAEGEPVVSYIRKLEGTCFVCDRIQVSYPRYVNTIFHLWKKDSLFREKFEGCKGFCITHYKDLYEASVEELSGKGREEFLEALDHVFFENIDRVNGDVDWFIQKYDYRNKDKPWKDAKDALSRAATKLGHIFVEKD